MITLKRKHRAGTSYYTLNLPPLTPIQKEFSNYCWIFFFHIWESKSETDSISVPLHLWVTHSTGVLMNWEYLIGMDEINGQSQVGKFLEPFCTDGRQHGSSSCFFRGLIGNGRKSSSLELEWNEHGTPHVNLAKSLVGTNDSQIACTTVVTFFEDCISKRSFLQWLACCKPDEGIFQCLGKYSRM